MFRSGGPAIARDNCSPHRNSASSNRNTLLTFAFRHCKRQALSVARPAVVTLEEDLERVSCSIYAFVHPPGGAIACKVVSDAARDP